MYVYVRISSPVDETLLCCEAFFVLMLDGWCLLNATKFQVSETYLFTYSAPRSEMGGETYTLTMFKDEAVKIGGFFKAHTL